MTDTSYSHAINLDNYRETSLNYGFKVCPDTRNEGQFMVCLLYTSDAADE